MTINKESYLEFEKVNRTKTTRTNTNRVVTDQLRQAAVRSGKLVGTPEWDLYLSQLEAIIQEVQDIRDFSRKTLESPKIVNYEKMMECKMVLRESQAIIDTLKQVIKLPYAIVHNREEMKEIKSNIPIPEPPGFATTE